MNQQQQTTASLLAQIEALKAENAKILANKASAGSSIKVSAKGAVSLYGMGRFPVTLYASQWQQLAAKMPEVLAFIKANESILAHKVD